MPEPETMFAGGEYRFSWPSTKIGILYSRVHDSKADSITGDIFVTTTAEGFGPHLRWERFNLSSSRTRSMLAKDLEGVMPLGVWERYLEQSCVMTMLELRKGEPVIEIGTLPTGASGYLIDGLVLRDNPTMIFADGGAGKSLFGLACLFHVEIGMEFLGRDVGNVPGRGLYLDYEFTPEEHNDRLIKLAKGTGVAAPPILYRRCTYPLTEDINAIQRIVREHGVTFVLIDSAGAACGGEPENAELVIKFFGALRMLHISSLVLHHTPKDKNNKSPFGSRYWYNLSRFVWEMRSEITEGSGRVKASLFNIKNNSGMRQQPFGIEFDFGAANDPSGGIVLRPLDPKTSPAYLEKVSIATKMLYALDQHPAHFLTAKEISDIVGESINAVDHALKRNLHQFVQVAGKWGRKSERDESER